MTKPLSIDIRECAMARLEAGETVRAVADALRIAPSKVVKWSGRKRSTGNVAPGKIGGHVLPKIRGWMPSGRAAGWLNGPSPITRGSASRTTALASEHERQEIAGRQAGPIAYLCRPGARLSRLPVEGDRAFQAQC